MTLEEIVKSIADTVKESIKSAVGGVYEKYDSRFLEIESQIKSLPKPEKGDSVTIDDVKPMVEELIKGLELPKGDKGDSVTIEDVRPIIEELVKSIEIPKDEREKFIKKEDFLSLVETRIDEIKKDESIIEKFTASFCKEFEELNA